MSLNARPAGGAGAPGSLASATPAARGEDGLGAERGANLLRKLALLPGGACQASPAPRCPQRSPALRSGKAPPEQPTRETRSWGRTAHGSPGAGGVSACVGHSPAGAAGELLCGRQRPGRPGEGMGSQGRTRLSRVRGAGFPRSPSSVRRGWGTASVYLLCLEAVRRWQR